MQSRQLIKVFKERVIVLVEIRNGFSKDEIDNLYTELETKDFIKSESLEFTSKDQALEMMLEDFGSEVDIESFNLGNPLFDVISFHVKSDFVSSENLDKIASELKEDDRVGAVNYQESLTGGLSDFWKKLGWFGLGFAFLLVFLAVFLIRYAIRQALYADRFLIKNQHLVGATPGFISRPYIRKGLIGGLASGIVASIILLIFRVWVVLNIPEMSEWFTLGHWFRISLVLCLLGAGIAALSSGMTVKSYLKTSVNQLFD